MVYTLNMLQLMKYKSRSSHYDLNLLDPLWWDYKNIIINISILILIKDLLRIRFKYLIRNVITYSVLSSMKHPFQGHSFPNITQTHMHICTHTHTNTHRHTYTYTHTNTHTYAHTHTHTQTQSHISYLLFVLKYNYIMKVPLSIQSISRSTMLLFWFKVYHLIHIDINNNNKYNYG